MLTIFLVDINLLGMISLWGMSLNAVTVVNLVLAIGIALDYSSHIAHSYTIAEGNTRIEKVKYALTHIGGSVFHGATSTLLAVISLSFTQAYVFVVFFRMWLGILLFGFFHGIVFLPILLSFIGPISKKTPESTAKPQETVEKLKSVLDLEKKRKFRKVFPVNPMLKQSTTSVATKPSSESLKIHIRSQTQQLP